jgi:hypothetical protein
MKFLTMNALIFSLFAAIKNSLTGQYGFLCRSSILSKGPGFAVRSENVSNDIPFFHDNIAKWS